MNKASNEPRPTLREFLGCCRTEFAFLLTHGFHEASAAEAGHPDPYHFRMVGDFLELYAHGIDYGSRTGIHLRDRSGHELCIGDLIDTSRPAASISRRRHPDGQRADIMAAARALRDSPGILAAHDLSSHGTKPK